MAAAAQDGWTALIRAGYNGHADCVRLLLDAGADKNAKANVRASAGWGWRVGGVWEMSAVFRFCVGAFLRAMMVLT